MESWNVTRQLVRVHRHGNIYLCISEPPAPNVHILQFGKPYLLKEGVSNTKASVWKATTLENEEAVVHLQPYTNIILATNDPRFSEQSAAKMTEVHTKWLEANNLHECLMVMKFCGIEGCMCYDKQKDCPNGYMSFDLLFTSSLPLVKTVSVYTCDGCTHKGNVDNDRKKFCCNHPDVKKKMLHLDVAGVTPMWCPLLKNEEIKSPFV